MSLFTFDISNTKAKWIDTQPSLHEIMVVYVSMAPGPFACVFSILAATSTANSLLHMLHG
jgi:hypothetical protein